ncbi:MAG: GyrI-like domain-containing protein [Armatimonadota bacterium]|nr:GyrI-like domain-containing protein [bacterium]
MSQLENNQIAEPQIVEFGPYRVIGMRYAGKNENAEIKAMWDGENGFLSRMSEIDTTSGECMSFGLCRCIPGVTDGSFEYIAALPANPDALVPEGMVEASIGAATYAVFTVPSLGEISQVWTESMAWLAAHPNWDGYCNETACECADYPGFELYPADFGVTGKLFLYMPVRPKAN